MTAVAWQTAVKRQEWGRVVRRIVSIPLRDSQAETKQPADMGKYFLISESRPGP